MSSTGAPEPPASVEDLEFFRAIEESFLQMRGRTTLLGPEDFQVAQAWRHAGIPIELVRRVMSDLFARQQQRRSKRGISSLRYFRAAVEAAWRERLELAAGAAAPEADPGPPLAVRLDRLAAALPEELPSRTSLAATIRAQAGTFAEVEEELTRIERGLLDELERSLDPAARESRQRRVETALARLGQDLAAEERAEVARRLGVQVLREQFRLPLLSLFSPVALGAAETSGAD